MVEDLSHDNRFATQIAPMSQTLGVEEDLRRFARKEYLESRNQQVLVGTSDHVVDQDTPPDDMLLTNALTEDKVQDQIDKTRYLKEIKSYVTINSIARQMPTEETMDQLIEDGGYGNDLFSTGGHYVTLFNFAPYVIVDVDGETTVPVKVNMNQIRFRLQDHTHPTNVVQVLTPLSSKDFDVYLPLSNGYTLDQLQTALEISVNMVASTGHPLANSPSPKHMFSFNVTYNPHINPDRVTIQVTSQSNFEYTLDFYSQGSLTNNPIAAPIPATDAEYVVQNPNVGCTDATFANILPTVYPFANCYALNLDKTYKNIKSIRVISSEIPNTDTIINSYNNHITFQLIDKRLPAPTRQDPYSQNIRTKSGSIVWEVYLPYGNYNLAQLVAEIEQAINQLLDTEAELENVFKITANAITNTFIIATKNPYAFTWDFNANSNYKSRNLYVMLGFPVSAITTYTSQFDNLINLNVGTVSDPHFIKKPYQAIVLMKSNVVWLQLNNYEDIYDTATNVKYFCQFSLDGTPDNTYAHDTFVPNVHVFVDIPKAELNSVDVRIYDNLGLPYNFNGADHSFVLEITQHIDRVMGNDLSSRRDVRDHSSYV